MNTSSRFGVLALLASIFCALTATAHAQMEDDLIPADHSYISPEHFTVEFRGGPYEPDLGSNRGFKTFFNDDLGPHLGVELQYILLRIDDIMYATVGGAIGFTSFTGKAVDPTGTEVSEETSLSIIPITALGALRIDALSRKLEIPFNFAGKLGWQWASWSTGTGKRDDANGWSMGLVYGGQVALDLDTLEPSAARAMDEEWGINHSYVLFELYRFAPTSKSLPIGDTSWLLGLGFTF